MMPVQMCVDGANYLVHVWDTAGTPQYQSVVPMFCRDTNIALLVFDVTKKSTFDKILSWYDFVRGNSYPYFILIGNKIDLEEREVSKQAAIELAEELKADYYETSSATREGIEDMKKGICQAIVTVNSTCIVSKPTSRIKTQTLQNESKCC
ncbi:small GTP-binding protein [Tritrichomonas foetus]|uniref:Small GTP-binding protein n=1 Tax=Tritrichomonas foetus TaxID=1144522 RepID=A0A1J4JS90_9EUKA|nr:small GTP-binding protein [Tritrichomonas foetus]|eukprot:OHT00388.1 small GTP-binding protein [Tritrichomonas foetus]